MRNVTLSLLAAVLAAGCGSSPVAPTPAAVSAPTAVSFGLQFTPDSVTGKGWYPPTAVTLRAASFVPQAKVEKAVFRMIDDRKETLAEASIAIDGPIPPDGYMDATAVVQTLTWPADRGFGKRLDMVLTLRTPSGELTTFTTSINAK
jgi:hypothetical protein